MDQQWRVSIDNPAGGVTSAKICRLSAVHGGKAFAVGLWCLTQTTSARLGYCHFVGAQITRRSWIAVLELKERLFGVAVHAHVVEWLLERKVVVGDLTKIDWYHGVCITGQTIIYLATIATTPARFDRDVVTTFLTSLFISVNRLKGVLSPMTFESNFWVHHNLPTRFRFL